MAKGTQHKKKRNRFTVSPYCRAGFHSHCKGKDFTGRACTCACHKKGS